MPGPRIGVLWLCTLAASGCAATFAPPARGDLDFAAARLQMPSVDSPGGQELRVHGQSADGGVYQLGWRRAVGSQDQIEAFVFGHRWPGRRNGFLMTGVGYRRLLGHFDDRIVPSLGFGAGIGAGGQVAAWSDEIAHRPMAMGGYVDVGVSWRCLGQPPGPSPSWRDRALTLYAGGRVARSMAWWLNGAPAAEFAPDAQLPPITDWAQGGGGARLDLGPLSWSVDAGVQTYANRVKDDHGATFASSFGWRW